MTCLKPSLDAALDRRPILHELVRTDAVLVNHFAQGVAQIVAQERDAMGSGIGLCVGVSVGRHNPYPPKFQSTTRFLLLLTAVSSHSSSARSAPSMSNTWMRGD